MVEVVRVKLNAQIIATTKLENCKMQKEVSIHLVHLTCQITEACLIADLATTIKMHEMY